MAVVVDVFCITPLSPWGRGVGGEGAALQVFPLTPNPSPPRGEGSSKRRNPCRIEGEQLKQNDGPPPLPRMTDRDPPEQHQKQTAPTPGPQSRENRQQRQGNRIPRRVASRRMIGTKTSIPANHSQPIAYVAGRNSHELPGSSRPLCSQRTVWRGRQRRLQDQQERHGKSGPVAEEG